MSTHECAACKQSLNEGDLERNPSTGNIYGCFRCGGKNVRRVGGEGEGVKDSSEDPFAFMAQGLLKKYFTNVPKGLQKALQGQGPKSANGGMGVSSGSNTLQPYQLAWGYCSICGFDRPHSNGGNGWECTKCRVSKLGPLNQCVGVVEATNAP